MIELIPLHMLPVGQTGFIEQITGEITAAHRLGELGFRVGALIEMVQSGSACIVRIGGHKVGFRADAAAIVYVRQTIPLGVAG